MLYASYKLFALSYEGNKKDLDFTVKLAVSFFKGRNKSHAEVSSIAKWFPVRLEYSTVFTTGGEEKNI